MTDHIVMIMLLYFNIKDDFLYDGKLFGCRHCSQILTLEKYHNLFRKKTMFSDLNKIILKYNIKISI